MWHAIGAYVLPIVSLLGGIAALFVDAKTNPRGKWFMISLLVLSAVGTGYSSQRDQADKEKAAKQETVNSQTISSLSITAQNLSNTISAIKQDTGKVLIALQGRGLDPSIQQTVQNSLEADKPLANITPAVRQEASTKNVEIIYYAKNVDGPVVQDALAKGGFTKTEIRPGNPANAALKTNAIWVGSNVTTEQAKFVALTLLRAGVGIVSIRKGFKKDNVSKANLIEIGVDASLVGESPMTAEQIAALTEIPINNSASEELQH